MREKIGDKGSAIKVASMKGRLGRDLFKYINSFYKSTPFHKLRELVFRDSQVASLWNTRLTALSLDYEIRANGSSGAVHEFVLNQFEKFSIFELSKLFMNAIAFGFACLELTWEEIRLKGKPYFWVKNIDFILNELIEIKDDRVFYLGGFNSEGKIRLNPFKYILLINGREHGEEGFPLFTTVYSECVKKEIADFYHTCFIERLTGALVEIKSKTGETTPEDDLAVLEKVSSVENFYSVVHPDIYEIKIHEFLSKDATNHTFLSAKEYSDLQIAKLILGQTLTTQTGTTGSYAISKTHQEVREDYAAADRRFVEEGFFLLIKRIVDLNFKEQEFYPEFKFIRKFDEKGRLERDINLAKEFGIKFNQNYFAKTYGIDAEDMI